MKSIRDEKDQSAERRCQQECVRKEFESVLPKGIRDADRKVGDRQVEAKVKRDGSLARSAPQRLPSSESKVQGGGKDYPYRNHAEYPPGCQYNQE